MKKNKLLIISLISLVLFILLLINLNSLLAVDILINSSISTIQNNYLISISEIIGYIFEPLYVILASLIISAAVFFSGKKKQALFFALIMLASGAITYVLKFIIERARPENALILENSSSFPSGHALISIVLFGFVIYYFISGIKSGSRRIIFNLFLVLLILIIGFSRIYLSVHWASDVLAGWLFGLFILTCSILIKEKYL